MTAWSQKTQASAYILAALVIGSIIIFGNQGRAYATGNDISNTVFCLLNAQGNPTNIFEIGEIDCTEQGGTPTACSDGEDNDNDGLVDMADPGCANGSDDDETNAVVPPPGACEDGDDNDNDGFTDTLDPNCHTDGDATNADSYDGDREETGGMPACWDGIDNDDDGKTDWGLPNDENRDPGCSTPTDNSEVDGGGGNENGNEDTLQLCTDTTDNDNDDLTDLADPDCASFLPKLVVLKVVINDNAGTSTVSSFPLFITKTSEPTAVVSGATTTVSVGVWTVTETSSSGYTATFSGNCNASGQVTLAAGDTKTCIVTNNDVSTGDGGGGNTAQCADGSDNDQDGKIDMNDPGCTDSADNDETDPAPVNTGGGCGNNCGGGGNGPIFGSSFGNGPVVAQVLGAATSTLPSGCTALIGSYMRMGKKDNDPAEVKKLQQFLNEQVGANLPITGYFGRLTDAAVRKFQSAHTSEVLTPWGIDAPTGFVYQTTLRWINLTHCRTLIIPIPVLTPFKDN